MPQSPPQSDPGNGKPDSGLGVGAGFGIGALIYVVSWILLIFVGAEMPPAGILTYPSTTLIAHLVINGGLIGWSMTTGRKKFAQGLMISAALAVLLDGACWGIFQ